jgi:hypothetical protein
VSWQSSLGVPTETVFEDNRDVWSGDHCSLDPTSSAACSSRRGRSAPTDPGIADVTASVRALFGSPKSRTRQGRRSGEGPYRVGHASSGFSSFSRREASPRRP